MESDWYKEIESGEHLHFISVSLPQVHTCWDGHPIAIEFSVQGACDVHWLSISWRNLLFFCKKYTMFLVLQLHEHLPWWDWNASDQTKVDGSRDDKKNVSFALIFLLPDACLHTEETPKGNKSLPLPWSIYTIITAAPVDYLQLLPERSVKQSQNVLY